MSKIFALLLPLTLVVPAYSAERTQKAPRRSATLGEVAVLKSSSQKSPISQQPTASQPEADKTLLATARFSPNVVPLSAAAAKSSTPSNTNPFTNALQGLACLSHTKAISDPLGAEPAVTSPAETIVFIPEAVLATEKPVSSTHEEILAAIAFLKEHHQFVVPSLELLHARNESKKYAYAAPVKKLTHGKTINVTSFASKDVRQKQFSSTVVKQLENSTKRDVESASTTDTPAPKKSISLQSITLFEKLRKQPVKQNMIDPYAIEINGARVTDENHTSRLDITRLVTPTQLTQTSPQHNQPARATLLKAHHDFAIKTVLETLEQMAEPREIEEKATLKIKSIEAAIKELNLITQYGNSAAKLAAVKKLAHLDRQLAGLKGRLQGATEDRDLKHFFITALRTPNTVFGSLAYFTAGAVTEKTVEQVNSEGKKHKNEELIKKYTKFLAVLKALPAQEKATWTKIGNVLYEIPEHIKAPSLLDIYAAKISALEKPETEGVSVLEDEATTDAQLSTATTALRTRATALEMSAATDDK